MLARTLMVQGTASSVGKSLMVTALCRIFHRRGVRVAPFKSQNMALNSFVTPDGYEIGRAQAVQAEAAGIEPAVEMNPILLKPEGGMRSQVVMMGRAAGSIQFGRYRDRNPEFQRVIADSMRRLRERYELVVIEGAGSPAEINLRGRDLANMFVAELADAPVILVGDIDRGGVFAQLLGTIELLEPPERARVAAFLINKFRGERALLESGLQMLAARLGIPALGVVPYLGRLRIADEDSVALDERRRQSASATEIGIAVVRLPGISNYDDFLALEHTPGVALRFIERAAEAERADLLAIPGSKRTVADLEWMRARGLAATIAARAQRGQPVLGICGGCQMLGERIEDPERVESDRATVEGLGLLPLVTRFERAKLTAQVRARVHRPSFLSGDASLSDELSAYEIHMGRVTPARAVAAPFAVMTRNGNPSDALDGAIGADGAVVGTMLHGIFENDPIRRSMLRALAERKGLSGSMFAASVPDLEAEYDRLASAVEANIDCARLNRLVGL